MTDIQPGYTRIDRGEIKEVSLVPEGEVTDVIKDADSARLFIEKDPYPTPHFIVPLTEDEEEHTITVEDPTPVLTRKLAMHPEWLSLPPLPEPTDLPDEFVSITELNSDGGAKMAALEAWLEMFVEDREGRGLVQAILDRRAAKDSL